MLQDTNYTNDKKKLMLIFILMHKNINNTNYDY